MPGALPDFMVHLGHEVYAIDTGFHRPRFDAAYLMVQDGHAAFVDTGTNYSVPRLLEALDVLGIQREAVDYVIPTHVHLDHAGGVGLLMQALPRAQALVHERGARHMIDPTALYMGATAVYGPQEMERSYGKLIPVASDRVQATQDEMSLDWRGRALRFIDTPGHARHHHCIWDARSQGWFTGDTFGLSYREFDTGQGAWIMPTTTPVQFEPEPLKHSIERLMKAQPERMYLTHYCSVDQPAVHAKRLLRLIDEMVSIGLEHAALENKQRHQHYKTALHQVLLADVRLHGCTASALSDQQVHELLELDVELNAQGLGIWVDKQRKAAASQGL